jgi:hypothetical protein
MLIVCWGVIWSRLSFGAVSVGAAFGAAFGAVFHLEPFFGDIKAQEE